MSSLLGSLPDRERRGSRPRCILLTEGSDEQVADRLTALAEPHAVVLPGRHVWAPRGVSDPAEAKLGESPSPLSPGERDIVTSWWLAARSPRANTPNWDILSQATINAHEGLILVEAKAHDAELINAEKGKSLSDDASENGRRNHEQIEQAIGEANAGLNKILPGWSLSRDSHYQMSNRFAWAWKLTQLGFPVILVFLGFLNAHEMKDNGKLFTTHEEWEHLVKRHSEQIVPVEAWGKKWDLHGQVLIPLIRTVERPLDS